MPFGWFLKMFFVWGKMHARTKTWTFLTQKESTHTPGLLSRVKKKREREKETKCINSKNAPSALERHRSQI